MSADVPDVREFFESYARSRTVGDGDGIASQYSDSFTFAGPSGARIVQKAAVLAAFQKGRAFLQGLGHTTTEVLSIEQMSLDRHYLLVKATFGWCFERPPASPVKITIASTFVLYAGRDGLTIVFQQEHEDFQDALRSGGVLTA